MTTKQLDDEILRLAKAARLEDWNSFVEELQVPSELFPALATNRPELVRLAPRRALTAEEADALYKLIAALIETNQALRAHASQVADMATQFAGGINGVISTAMKIKRFAQFRHAELDEELELEVK